MKQLFCLLRIFLMFISLTEGSFFGRLNFFRSPVSFLHSFSQILPEINDNLQYHGTTTLAFKSNQSVIVCVDSKASLGNYVGSRTVRKVIPVSDTVVATMAGGAADCAFHIKELSASMKMWTHQYGSELPVVALSRMLSSRLKQFKGLGLSVGTMIAGHDKVNGASLFYVDSEGGLIEGEMFCVGSGSILAYSILDNHLQGNFSQYSRDDSIEFAITALRIAVARDGYSGGYINVLEVNQSGIFHLQRINVQRALKS